MRLRKILPVALAAISAFVALSVWAFASPPGSAPDDDFHLPAIWCSHGAVEGICDPEVAGDGYGKTPTPLSPSAICFAFNSSRCGPWKNSSSPNVPKAGRACMFCVLLL